MDEGRPRDAVSLVKGASKEAPDDGSLALLLAWSYLQAGNDLWATRTLLARVDADPDDAQARAWASWLLIQDGDIARARPLLEQAPGAMDLLDVTRFGLIRVALLELEGQADQAGELLSTMRDANRVYPEDRALFDALRLEVLGDRGQPIDVRVQASSGVASNVIESAPQDVGSGGAGVREPRAPIAGLDVVLRYEPWSSPRFRPMGELRSKGFTPFSSDAAAFGYFTSGVRAGVELGPSSGTRARLLYGAEIMGLRGDGDPDDLDAGMEPVEGGLVMEAHRGDLELDLGPGVQLFAGGGRRIYRELRRTRTELDAGGAWVLPFGSGWNLTTVATGRAHFARHPGWDAWGLTGLMRLRAPLPGGHMLKLRGMVLWDSWPRFGQWEPTVDTRGDLAARLQLGPWTRDLHGWRVGLTYNLAVRASSLDAYDYTDHRALVELRWQRSWNPGSPRPADLSETHLPLPYDLDQGGDQGLDRVQDLLRQEDSARRGSSCVD